MPTSRPPYPAAFRQQMVEHPGASNRNAASAAGSASALPCPAASTTVSPQSRATKPVTGHPAA